MSTQVMLPNFDILKSCKSEHYKIIHRDLKKLIAFHTEKRLSLMKELDCLPENFLLSFNKIIEKEVTHFINSMTSSRGEENDIM